MKRTKPPFRADHVGSFLRTAALKEARAKREKGADQRRPSSRRSRTRRSRRSSRSRRRSASSSRPTASSAAPGGTSISSACSTASRSYELDHGIQFQGVQTKPQSLRITGKIGLPATIRCSSTSGSSRRTPSVDAEDDASRRRRCCTSASSRTPSTRTSIRTATPSSTISRQAYRKAVKAFYDAGCRYLQFDDTAWAYLCSRGRAGEGEASAASNVDDLADDLRRADQRGARRQARRHGRSPRMSAAATSARPGSRRAATSRWPSSCSAQCNYDGYFLEYDSERAGGFEPLRFLPKGNKIVVLGLITSKSGTLEKQGRRQAPHRRGGQVRAARAARAPPAVRLRLDRGGQRPHRGAAVGEDARRSSSSPTRSGE